jgi:serine/threonine protein kinase
MTTVFNRLGPYEIVEPIGSGGMAQVFLALDTRTNQRVALRLVPIGRDREAKEILEAERWGARLQQEFSSVCPLLPRVYEHGELPDYFYVSMEYLDGENLSDVIGRGRIQQERAVAIALELCGFLEAAHGFEVTVEGRSLRSLLHGDLKPRNVRVTSSGRIKVLDFGMAKALSLSRKVTRTDFGTLGYMSPERLESGEMDAQSDCWALGVILYQMVSGTPPFAAPDTRRLERLIVSRRPPPSLEAFCLPGFQAIVAKLLAGEPEQRYPNATAVREDLARHQAGEETQAQKDGWPARLDEPPTQRTRPLHEVADEATRRTRFEPPPPAAAPEPPPPAPTPLATAAIASVPTAPAVPAPPPPKAAAVPRRRRRLRTLLMLGALFLVINEVKVGNAAGRLAAAAVTRELDQIDELWTEYDRLSDRSYLGMGITSLQQALTERTQELADRVIYNYRTPEPTVREAQWDAARNALRRALMAAPRNERIKAAMRYCDGHLHRINGEARKTRRQLGPALEEFTEAVTAFREAAELRSDWPDPFLGLMRVFIYGLDDIDRGADALRQAQRLGFNAGRRETTQLADGYRTRGETLMRTARTLEGVPQETEYLQRAAESLREALTLYGRVPGSDGVATSLRRTHLALERIELRLSELAAPAAENPDKLDTRQPSTVPPAPPSSPLPSQIGERVGASPAWR